MSDHATTTSQHTSRAKDPAIVAESQNIIHFIEKILWWAVFIVVLFGVIFGVRGCISESNKKAEAEQIVAVEYAKNHPPTPATTALVLRFDGFTPCDPEINFRFELDTQGDPISLKFPGVSKPLEYSGKGTLNAPENRTSGSVRITSLDSRKQARVRVYEVITVPRR
jgi:hypothetical protein